MKRLILCLLAMASVVSIAAQSEYDNEVIRTIMARRSVRKYLDKPVEHSKLQAIVECGINAPSALNKQPWLVRVVEDTELIAQVTEVFKQEYPEVFKQENSEQVVREAGFKNMFHGAQALICVCTPAQGGGEVDAGLMGENMMLAAQSLGLGTCCQMGPVRFLLTHDRAKFFLERLDIPSDFKLFYIIGVGYPDEQPDAKPRDASKVKYIGAAAAAETGDADQIYTVVDQLPQFPGGNEACYKWLTDNILYPKDCEKAGVSGLVLVSFTVEKDGTISDVKAIRSPHQSLSREGERVVKAMPKWQPGKQAGKIVRSKMNLPINFKLKK